MIEFWKTVKDPGYATHPDPIRSVYEFLNQSYPGAGGRPLNRYYARKLINVEFTETAGLQTLTYDTTDIYSHFFTLFIEMQPEVDDIMMCIRMNSQLYAFGTDGRNDGGYT